MIDLSTRVLDPSSLVLDALLRRLLPASTGLQSFVPELQVLHQPTTAAKTYGRQKSITKLLFDSFRKAHQCVRTTCVCITCARQSLLLEVVAGWLRIRARLYAERTSNLRREKHSCFVSMCPFGTLKSALPTSPRIKCSIRSAPKCDAELATRIIHAIMTLAMPRSSLNNACACPSIHVQHLAAAVAKCWIQVRLLWPSVKESLFSLVI